VLKENLDHALVIPIESKSVRYSDQGEGETWTLTSQADKRSDPVTWTYQCPKGAVYPIRSVNLDKNVIASSFSKSLGHRFPDTITHFKVKLREEKVDPTEAVFRYTHGIENHEGLCQRLFHGHRSCLEVYLGDIRRPDLEQHVVWQVFNKSVHIASQDQLITKGLESGQRSESSEPIEIGYQTAKGYYRATLPANKVFVVDHQTSIEQIATTLATVVRNEIGPTDQAVKVVCYEGIEKGAIAKA
jgi:6-pyruvoyl-tetrahydropterin synthase